MPRRYNAMDQVFTALQILGVIGGGYLGYSNAHYLQDWIQSPWLKIWKERLGVDKAQVMNETNICRVTAALGGMATGRSFWFLILPLSMAMVEKDHGKEIREVLDKLRK